MVEANNATRMDTSHTAYVAELREFLGSRGVPFGSPDDLPAFLTHLEADEAFAEETGSLLRAFSYAEDQRLGRIELLRLVATAVAGAGEELATEGVHGSLKPLFQFVTTALRPPSFFAGQGPFEPFEPHEAEIGFAGPELPGTSAPLAPSASKPAPESEPPPPPAPSRRADLYLRAQELSGVAPELASNLQEDPDDLQGKALPAAAPPVAARKVAPRRASLPAAASSQARGLGQRWILPVLAGGLAVLGFGVYMARPVSTQLAPQLASQRAPESAAAVARGPALATCLAPTRAGVTRAALDERGRWAQRLLEGKLYESALPEFEEIARMDPGFPGVNLDESEALLHLGRLDEAQAAVDQQLGLVDCLARLPSTALDLYCKTQYASLSGAGCRPQLAQLRQAAQLQSALVQLSIDHWSSPTPVHVARPARTQRRVRPAASKPSPLPPATEEDQGVPPLPRHSRLKSTS